MKKVALIFPGQGAQIIGMGKDFYDAYPLAKEVFQEADEILERSLSKLIFTGSSDELDKTKNSQPALFTVSMALLKVLEKEMPDLEISFCGGLSLGEYSALAAAQIVGFKEALELVARRGEFMEMASLRHPGGMAAVLGLSEAVIKEAGITVANVNSPGQIVVAYSKQEAEKVQEKLLALGAKKVIPLRVSGAFHSPLMKEAEKELAPLIRETIFHKGRAQIVMNCVGTFVEDREEMKELLIAQVSSTTRWMRCVEAMIAKEPSLFIEIGPTQLTAMYRKMGSALPIATLEKISDWDKVYETVGK